MWVLAQRSAGNFAVDTAFRATASLPDWSQRRMGAEFFKVDGYSAEHRRNRRKQKENKLTQGEKGFTRRTRNRKVREKGVGVEVSAIASHSFVMVCGGHGCPVQYPPAQLSHACHGPRRRITHDFAAFVQCKMKSWVVRLREP